MATTGPEVIPPSTPLELALRRIADPDIRGRARDLCNEIQQIRSELDSTQQPTEASQKRSADGYALEMRAHDALIDALPDIASQQRAVIECGHALQKLFALLQKPNPEPFSGRTRRAPDNQYTRGDFGPPDVGGSPKFFANGQPRDVNRPTAARDTDPADGRRFPGAGMPLGDLDTNINAGEGTHGVETVGHAINRLREELMAHFSQARIDTLTDQRALDIMSRMKDLEQHDRSAPCPPTPLPPQPVALDHYRSAHRKHKHTKRRKSTPYPTPSAAPWDTLQPTFPYEFNNYLSGATPRVPSPVIPFVANLDSLSDSESEGDGDLSSTPVSRKRCYLRRLLRRIQGSDEGETQAQTQLPAGWGGRNQSQQAFPPHAPFNTTQPVQPLTPFGATAFPPLPDFTSVPAPLQPVVPDMPAWYKVSGPTPQMAPGAINPFHAGAFTPNATWAPTFPLTIDTRTPWIAPVALAYTPVIYYNPIPVNVVTGQPARQVFPPVSPMQWAEAYASCGARIDAVYETVFPAFSRYSDTPPLEIERHLVLNPANCLDPNLRWDLTQNPKAVGCCLARSSRGLLHNATDIFSKKVFTLDEHHLQDVGPKKVMLFAEPGQEMLCYMMLHHWGPIELPRKLPRDVTVGDVVESIYAYLREPLTAADHTLILSNSTRARDDMRSWRNYRTSRQTELEMDLTKKQYRRIDAMGHDRYFLGLRQEVFEDGQWTIRVSFGRGIGQY